MISKQKVGQWLGVAVDGSSLGVFRICFGIAVACSVWKFVIPDSVVFSTAYVSPDWNFPYVGFEWVRPLPAHALKAVFVLLWAASVCVALGVFYRVAAPVLFVCYTYTFLLETSSFNNHYYLISLLSFLLIWMPADRRFAVPFGRAKKSITTVSCWTVLLLRLQLFVVYFYGGIAKINADFLTGEPIIGSAQIFCDGLSSVLPFFEGLEVIVVALAMAWIGLVFDLSIGFLLWIKRTQWIGLGLLLIFHLINHLTLPIGVFPFLGFAASLIFLAPDWPLAFWRWIESRLGHPSGVSIVQGAVGPRSFPVPNGVIYFVGAWLAFQTLFPLRHFLIEGDPSWTEEGQNFAWRMMLRQKSGGNLVYHLHDDEIYEPGSMKTRIDWTKTPGIEFKGIVVGIDASRFTWSHNQGLNTLYEGVTGFRLVQAIKSSTPAMEKEEMDKLREWWESKTGKPAHFVESISPRQCLENALKALSQLDPVKAKPMVEAIEEALGLIPETSSGGSVESKDNWLKINDWLFLAQKMEFGEVLRSELVWVHPFSLLGVATDQRFYVLAEAASAPVIQELSSQLGRDDHYIVWCDFGRLRNYAWAQLPEWFMVFESGRPVILWNYFGKLNRRQAEHLIATPYMIHQYANRIAAKWEHLTGRRPAIHGHGVVMMNYREPQSIVSPQVNLAAENYYLWKHNQWILPLKGERIGISERLKK